MDGGIAVGIAGSPIRTAGSPLRSQRVRRIGHSEFAVKSQRVRRWGRQRVRRQHSGFAVRSQRARRWEDSGFAVSIAGSPLRTAGSPWQGQRVRRHLGEEENKEDAVQKTIYVYYSQDDRSRNDRPRHPFPAPPSPFVVGRFLPRPGLNLRSLLYIIHGTMAHIRIQVRPVSFAGTHFAA